VDAECAGNRRKLIFTKYLHQVSYLFNACVHLISVYLSGTMCVSIIIQYNITTSSLLLSTSHNVYTCLVQNITTLLLLTVSYDEYFRQIFGGLGVLPVFWNSQERLTRNIFRKYFSPKYYSGNISQKSAPRQIFRAQIFLGQQIFSQQIFGGVAVTSKHVG